MKIVVFSAHPKAEESSSEQFLREALPEDITFFEVPKTYDEKLLNTHRHAIEEADRFFFQFPLYWYQAPGLLTTWLVDLLDIDFLNQHGETFSKQPKEMGVILTVGVPLRQYQAGGREQVTISELMRPFEALARAMGWTFLPTFVLEQHSYHKDQQQKHDLIRYQQHLTLSKNANFNKRSKWLIKKFQALLDQQNATLSAQGNLLIEAWEEKLEDLEELERNLPHHNWRK